jgi:VCBS repeat-containing protein
MRKKLSSSARMGRRHGLTSAAANAAIAGIIGRRGGVFESLETRRLFAVVATDKADYAFGETANITGGGFAPGETVELRVVHAEGTEGSNDDAQNQAWQVQVDVAGDLATAWLVNDPDAVGATYVLTATGLTSGEIGTTTFTDSRSINSVTLNGGTSVTVAPGASITAAVNVTTDNGGGNNDWQSTGWRISTTAPGTLTVVNHTNYTNSGTFTETFTITAPTTPGTYNAYFIAYANDTGTGGSAQASATFVLSASIVVNGAPVITLPGGPLSYTENAAPAIIDAGATAADADSANFAGGTLTVDYAAASGTADDRLAIRDQGTAAGQIGVSGADVTFGGTIIGTFAGGTGTTPLVITFNASSSPAAAQALMRNITFANVSENPSTAARTVRFVLTDGDGGTSNTATKAINVTAVNDAPAVAADNATVTVNEGQTAANTGTYSDVEGNTVAISASVGTITKTGTSTGTWSWSFGTSDGPPQSQTVTITANDGVGGVTTTTFALVVDNAAPTATANSYATAEDTGTSGNVITDNTGAGVDSDPAGANDPLAVSAVNGSGAAVGTATATTHGSVTVNLNGNFSYTPAANFFGTDSFTYTISDGDGGSSTATVTLTVTEVNDAPTANHDSATTSEDVAASGNVLTNDTDPDNADGITGNEDALAVTAVNGSGANVGVAVATSHGTVTLNANGSYTYTPAANYFGADSFTYTMSDGRGGSDTATLTITVNEVNDAPVASADSNSTNEDAAVSGNVLSNDTDADNTDGITGNEDALVVSAVNGSGAAIGISVSTPHGSVTVNADGSYTYSPSANFFGSDSFTYTVSDGRGGNDTATVTISIAEANDNPVANDDSNSTNEDNTVGGNVLTNDADVDNTDGVTGNEDTLVVSAVNGNGAGVGNSVSTSHGTVTVNANGSYSYSPAANFFGTDTFTYTVSDGRGGSDTATVTITVSEVNDAPLATADSNATSEDVGVSGNVLTNDADPDNTDGILGNEDALVVSAVNGSTAVVGNAAATSHGSVTVNANGSYTYTPALNFFGTDTFTYTVSDGRGGSDTATVTITISEVNDPPVANADTNSTNEDVAVGGNVLSNDTDADNADGIAGNEDILVVSAVNGSTAAVGTAAATSHGTVTVNANGSYTYTPAANFFGTDNFTYTVSDGRGGSDTATVTITVNEINDPPVANADANSTAEDVSASGNVLTNDADPDNTDGITGNEDTLLVTAVNGSGAGVGSSVATSHGSVSVNANGSYTYTPAPNYFGTDTFTYTVSDGRGGTSTATVTITVSEVNDPPVASADSNSTNEDTPVSGNVLANDTDPDNTDGVSGNEDTLVVSAVNGSTSAVGTAIATSHGTVTVNADGSYSYAPAANFFGTDSFMYTVSDGRGGSDTATVTITVNEVNDPPVANADTDTTNEDAGISGNVLTNDTDADNTDGIAGNEDTLVVSAVNGSAAAVGTSISTSHGTVTMNADGSYSYAPASNFFGTDSFTYTVSDGRGGSDTATVTITVNEVNDPPVANADSNSTNEDTPVGGNVIANDADPDNTDGIPGNEDILVVSAVNGSTSAVGTAVATSHGTVTVNANGSYTYAPAANYFGTDSFTYTVSDGRGGSDTATVTISIAEVNDPPVAGADSNSTNEDSAVGGNVLANDTDADNTDGVTGNEDTLVVSAVNGSAAAVGTAVVTPHGTVTVNADGSYSYSPAANFFGTDSFTYTVSDGRGGSDTATVTITVTEVNDAPVATADTNSTNEDTSVSGNVLTNDTDPDNTDGIPGNEDTLVVSAVNGSAAGVGTSVATSHGTVTVGADGSYTYSPAANYFGTDSFTYTVSDGRGGSATATVTITVTEVNDAPVAGADSNSTNEDNAVSGNVLANDIDQDNTDGVTGNEDTLTVSAVNGSLAGVGNSVATSHGSVTVNPDGSYTYTPALNFFGTDSFTYTVSDGRGGSDTATVTITVAEVNDAPAANADSNTTNEDSGVSGNVLANDTDADNADGILGNEDTLVVSEVNGSPAGVGIAVATGHGSVTLNANGSYTYTPAANFFGTDSFTYTVSDRRGGTSSATVTITVNEVNDAPVANADPNSTNEDTGVSGNLLTNDTDPDNTDGIAGNEDTLTVSAVNGSAAGVGTAVATDHGTVTVNANGSYTYTPAANYFGTDSFTYTVSDGRGGTSTATATITVAEVNDAPVADADTNSTSEDTGVSGNVLSNDTDPDNTDGITGNEETLVVSAVNGSAAGVGTAVATSHGSVTLNADGSYTYTPAPNFFGTDSFTYTVSDGRGGTSSATVTITVSEVNDPPVANADSNTTNEDAAIGGNVLTNDTDPDNTDGITGNEDTLAVSAVNGNAGAVGVATATAHGTVTVNANGSYTYTPASNYFGTDSFTYTISDGRGGTSSATVTLTINEVNDAPVASADANSTNEDNAISGNVLSNDTDPDNTDGLAGNEDTLVVSAVNGSPAGVGTSVATSHGTVTVNADGSYTYTPAANYFGTDSFTYTVSDGRGGSATATVTISVAEINDAPVAAADSNSTNEDTAASGNVLVNDTDADNTDGVSGNEDTLVVSAVNGSAAGVGTAVATSHGAVTVNANGSYTYTPAANYFGTDSFTYTVSDGRGGTSTETVTITIGEVNDTPVAGADSNSTNEDNAVSGNVLANDTDPDNTDGVTGNEDTLTVSAVNGSAAGVGVSVATSHGTVTVNADGTYTYTPTANYFGTDSFTYAISDGRGGTATATVTIDIAEVNDSPVATADSNATTEDNAVSGNVLGNDTDPDNTDGVTGNEDDVDAVLDSGPSHGTLAFNAETGAYTYTPAANYFGTDSFTYHAVDADGAVSSTVTVTITVGEVNDAPVAGADSAITPQDGSFIGDVLTNDTDPDNTDGITGNEDTLTVSAVNGNAAGVGVAVPTPHGSVKVNADGSYTYTPDLGYFGPDSFTYTISDGRGGTSTATVSITVTQAAGGSIYLTADPMTGASMLVINGTNVADTIHIIPANNPAGIEVFIQGVSRGVYYPTGRIVVFGYGGNDSITMAGSVNYVAWLYGDDGDDKLNLGNGGGLAFGGRGNDQILGGGGADIMIGGEGADSLNGNAGDDIFIAGYTNYDDRFNAASDHAEAWARIHKEWARTDLVTTSKPGDSSYNAYEQRIDHLTGAFAGGHNGAYVLTNVTVQDDNALDAIDVLHGGAGDDWFLWSKGEDKVTGMSKEENVTDLDSIT